MLVAIRDRRTASPDVTQFEEISLDSKGTSCGVRAPRFRVGWVESFGEAQDRLRDTHRSRRGGYRRCAPPPPYDFAQNPTAFNTPPPAAGFFICDTVIASWSIHGSEDRQFDLLSSILYPRFFSRFQETSSDSRDASCAGRVFSRRRLDCPGWSPESA
jgi:hypothetical protein